MRLTLLLALAATPALADGPSYFCHLATGDARKAICAAPDLAELDLEVARLSTAALEMAETADEIFLLNTERAAYLDTIDACPFSGSETCIADTMMADIARLRSSVPLLANLDEEGISAGPYAVTCGGISEPAGLIFAGDVLSRLVLMIGDERIVLDQGMSGSGARYERGSAEFWIKGNEARFTAEGAPETTCTIAD